MFQFVRTYFGTLPGSGRDSRSRLGGNRAPRGAGARLRRSSRQLLLETLEGRCLPSTVTSLADAGLGSLRQAIADTQPGGTVDFAHGLTGIILLTSSPLTVAEDLTIDGPGADVITVSGSNARTVFTIASQVGVQISGLTIADGGFQGGGIVNQGTLTVASSTFSGNSGGGIINRGGLTVTRSTFSGNSAGNGGGIVNQGTLTVTSSTFSGNSASNTGGGIYNSGVLTLTSSTLSGNSALFGGGISNEGTGTVTSSTLSGNSASNTGGGIYNGLGTLTVTSSSLSGNSASNTGGGIWTNSAPTVTHLRNSLLAANTALASPDVSGLRDSQGHNLIGDGSGGRGFADTDLVGTSVLPIDPLLGPLQDHGGPTFTMAVLPGSPALNAGDPDELSNPDQRGVVRSGGINIGAFQASAGAFRVTAPDTVEAGMPFDVTVTVVDVFGQVAVGYTGTLTFSSADPYGAILPVDYTITPDNQAMVSFSAGATRG